MSTTAIAMETEESVLNQLQDRSWRWHRDAAIALLLTVLAFAVRLNHVSFNSLSEDESAKWAAVQEYRHGHFVGVNSEHPMMLKVLAWGSLTAGERWNRLQAISQMPQQDQTAAEVEHSKEVLSISFVAHHQPAEVLQPGK